MASKMFIIPPMLLKSMKAETVLVKLPKQTTTSQETKEKEVVAVFEVVINIVEVKPIID